MSLNLTKQNKGDVIQFALAGKILSSEEVEEMDEIIYAEIDNAENKPKILLDLKDLNHTNSTGLNHFIRYFTKSRNKGGELVMINISPAVKKLFEITKLISVFTIAETQEEAEKILNDL
jgi:anti-anti-sigma factor